MAASAKARLVVCGAAGRMGRLIVSLVRDSADAELAGAVEAAGHATIGRDAGEVAGGAPLGVSVTADYAALATSDTVTLDFTAAEAALEHLRTAVAKRAAIVIGTTGFSPAEREEAERIAPQTRAIIAPNMSVGVNLCLKLLDTAARIMGDDVDIEIIEAHHRHKVDAPSGTALRMGEVVAGALGRRLEDCAVYGRQGDTGERDRRTIGFETIRAGDIVGEHTVMFAGLGERVEITHRASSRMTFASGALRAAVWLADRDSGVYDMQDVLGLR